MGSFTLSPWFGAFPLAILLVILVLAAKGLLQLYGFQARQLSLVASDVPSKCLICGVENPISHCLVRDDEQNRVIGRVCALHSLKDCIIQAGIYPTLVIDQETYVATAFNRSNVQPLDANKGTP